MNFFTDAALQWLETLLQERFGHVFRLHQKVNSLHMTLQGADQVVAFDQLQSVFHQSRSDFPCQQWQASADGYSGPIEDFIPAPSENELHTPLIELDDEGATIHYDILGLAYWMLTRLEEVGHMDLDNHQRFPATSSHAYQHGYLERPIVDEWLIVLGQVIQRVWPGVQLKEHVFSIKVSHDVDSPSVYAFSGWKRLLINMAGHLIIRHNYKAFIYAPFIKLMTGKQLHNQDPHNTFDWLMDVSEKNGLVSAFYFICGRSSNMDADYELENPIIQELMQRIYRRGHEVGLHPSYGSYQKPELIKKEANRLREICSKVGISQNEFGGRMHYLRWESPTTLQAWEDAGMSYDTTLSYADRPGFRCGTCFEYAAFNPISQQSLKIRIRPLIAMECTVIADRYMGLGYTEAALAKFLILKERCIKVSGCFTLLWHNSHFYNKSDFEMYEKILSI